MARRREPWERLFDGIRVERSPEGVYVPSVRDPDLDKLEGQFQSPLPHSYREFMKRFGPGELQGAVWIYPLVKHRKGGFPWTVAGRTTELWKFWPRYSDSKPNHEWLSTLIYFADFGGAAMFARDPVAATHTRPHECRFYCLHRHTEDQPVEVGDAFWMFVEWVDADIRSWRDPERLEEEGPGMYFAPMYLRAKKAPLNREVKRWLAWNDGTVAKLGRSIRDEGRPDVFPILADALEEAGCTNADLLTSCRQGIPDIDGSWVLQVLLGKEIQGER